MDRRLANDNREWDVVALADAQLHGEMSDEMAERLDLLLRTDAESRRRYVDYLQDAYHLHLLAVHALASEESFGDEAASETLLIRTESRELPSGLWSGAAGVFAQGMPLAYVVAAVILGFGLWMGALIPVYHSAQQAQAPLPSMPRTPDAKTQFVGRITAMVDCRWADPDTAVVGCVAVPLGRRYALASGLMEIAYDTGARVVLKGPATFEVDSRDGGFLSAGRLTARVEKKNDECRVMNDELQTANDGVHHSAFSIQHLFVVHTPTATVTDLGTEFGVEVADDGICEVHVIEGRVKAEWASAAGVQGGEMLLAANQAVRLDPARRHHTSITADTGRFRSMRTGLIRTPPLLWPILDKTFVAWVSLDNLEQRGVGVLSIVNMPQFDGIVFGELERGRWMAGSHGLDRTQLEQAGNPAETASPGELVQIAIVYNWTKITIYRNGEKYAEYNTSARQAFKKDSILLMGKRHLPNQTSLLPTLAGAIEEARLYNFAMPPEMIAKLKPGEVSEIRPVGQWTFEDGTARDATGHFPPGELQGNARIVDGRLMLDGEDSFLLVPAVERTELPNDDVPAVKNP